MVLAAASPCNGFGPQTGMLEATSSSVGSISNARSRSSFAQASYPMRRDAVARSKKSRAPGVRRRQRLSANMNADSSRLCRKASAESNARASLCPPGSKKSVSAPPD